MPKPLMRVMTTLAIAVLVAIFPVETSSERKGHSGRVLLVSMDGFRWDYLKTITGLGNFSRLATSGCSVDYQEPVFTTKTFPSHYTIATGLYQESHGIISNSMYDPVRNATFTKRSKESFWWDQGEPLWVTAERQNKRTGVYYWIGGDAEIRGYRPSTYLQYNESVPFPERVHTALDWLKSGGKDLVMLYFHEPDRTGHDFGPSSAQVADKVQEMDGILGLILNSMEELELDDVNVIITSDHGMTDVSSPDRLLNLWDFLNESTIEMVPDSGIVTFILPKEGQEEEVLSASRMIPNVTVYRKEEIPEYFHYKNNARITPIVILADEGWQLSSKYEKTLAKGRKGDHGYCNLLPSMRAIFLAAGPDFKKGVKATSIRSIDIYPLVCSLLNIQPAPNNGSLEKTAEFLVSEASGADQAIACGPFQWLCIWMLLVKLM